ncbi:MAG: SDR family NAD(P)-dependent oxidoreductase [Bacteroidota bacterium]
METMAISGFKERFRIREKLIRIKANPKKVSLGYALGVFLGTTPFIGAKVFIALIVTSLMKWNKISSIIGVYHINILTAPLFYGFSFLVGKWILGTDVVFVFPDTLSFSAFYEAFLGNSMIFFSLLFGGIVLGVPMAAGAYWFSMLVLRRHGGTEAQRHSCPDIQSSGHPFISHPASLIPLPSPPVYTLITGSSSGLGKEMAIECAEQGMNVILVALPGRNLDVLCELLEKEYGIIARYYEVDLSSRKAIIKLVEDLLKHYRINFLINNAGIGGTLPFDESTVDYIERIIQVNITAVSLLSRLLVSELLKHPESYILNVSSMAAFSPFPYKTIYPASKAFVSNFSRSLGQELKDTSVNVGVLHPGPILTNPDAIVRIIKQGANGRRGLLPARKLARIGITGVKRGKRVMIPGMGNIINWLMMTKLPPFIVMPTLSRVIVKEIKKEKQVAA